MLKQLTIFVENKQGSLVDITDTLAEKNVNLRALSIADTQDFGLLRLIVNDNDTALSALADKGYVLKVTEVVGVKIGDQPGKLSKALSVLAQAGVNVEMTADMLSDTTGGITQREKALSDAMKVMLGINPKVHLVAPKSIVRSEGKAVRVIDKRKLHD